MTKEEFIALNREADIRAVALTKVPASVNLHYCMRQIAGQQALRRKVPSLAGLDDIIYPERVSLEQCSSEQTALYKQHLVERVMSEGRHRMADLTGGFGVDFSFMAKLFDEAHYVEQNEELCRIARHNFPLIGLKNFQIHQTTSEKFLDGMGSFDFIFLDPSRRDQDGRKVVALGDCSPNMEELHATLCDATRHVMLKLSPLLDIKDALRRLPTAHEVHVVSVGGECKEVLLVLCKEGEGINYHCANITEQTQTFSTDTPDVEPIIASRLEHYLYEPNASILKAGVQNALCKTYNVEKLHPFSHLFISAHSIENFPGRRFVVEDTYSFSKSDIRRLKSDISQCNLTVRNFPSTVAELRKRLKLREGGDCYLFATTLGDGSHVLLKCRRADGKS